MRPDIELPELTLIIEALRGLAASHHANGHARHAQADDRGPDQEFIASLILKLLATERVFKDTLPVCQTAVDPFEIRKYDVVLWTSGYPFAVVTETSVCRQHANCMKVQYLCPLDNGSHGFGEDHVSTPQLVARVRREQTRINSEPDPS